MRPSLSGGQLPESKTDFTHLLTFRGALRYTECIGCGLDFRLTETATPAGWRETQISGHCEPCFDRLLPPEEDDLEEAGQ